MSEAKSLSTTQPTAPSEGRLKSFYEEVQGEMRKVTWPTREDLIGAALVIIVLVAILALSLGLTDFVLGRFTELFFTKNSASAR